MQKKRTRIQIINQQKILDAATTVFSKYGFRGGTIDQIADMAKMSKPNLLYYFKAKKDIYQAVLERTLNKWLESLHEWQVTGSPRDTLTNYIHKKMEFSRDYPEASRVFANEVMEGAPVLKALLGEDLKDIVLENTRVMKGWVKEGLIKNVDPIHIIFMIWAVTQHYADFEVQVFTLTGKNLSDEVFFKQAQRNVTEILLSGILK
jgi:TetR/AcrR family transcriptional regulator